MSPVIRNYGVEGGGKKVKRKRDIHIKVKRGRRTCFTNPLDIAVEFAL